MGYAALSTIQTIATGQVFTAATLQQANDNDEFLVDPPACSVYLSTTQTVATQGTPLPRVPKIRVPLHRYSAADQATILGLELGYRVTVTRTPQAVGSAITTAFLIDGIGHEVTETEWWWEAYVSPVPSATASVFVLGTSTLGGTHVLGY